MTEEMNLVGTLAQTGDGLSCNNLEKGPLLSP